MRNPFAKCSCIYTNKCKEIEICMNFICLWLIHCTHTHIIHTQIKRGAAVAVTVAAAIERLRYTESLSPGNDASKNRNYAKSNFSLAAHILLSKGL